ncbi:MAG: helix-turn-helix domain-containing protein [Geminicoccaceae bacterium]
MKRLAIVESEPENGPIASLGTVDQHVSSRIRQRRIMLGLAQQELAKLIGVTYQQAHKYETGVNRISAGRLYKIAEALGVEINYFYRGIGPDDATPIRQQGPQLQQRLLQDLAQHFLSIEKRQHQDAVCYLTRSLCRNA